MTVVVWLSWRFKRSAHARTLACTQNGPYKFGGMLLMKKFGAAKAGYLCHYDLHGTQVSLRLCVRV
jgi:hypothetical protein